MAKLVDERHAAWEADLPLGDDGALWDYLTVLDREKIAEGQGDDVAEPEEVDLPAFLKADLPKSVASMMATE